MSFRFGSVCSGIEAASVAWHPLGWNAVWFAEIEKFPSTVLAHHYPGVPNLGDMTGIARMVLSGAVEAPDALVGGTPCQAFSVAGMRKGLADSRGQLTISYVELANAIDTARSILGKQPAIVIWENVPGVLSSKDNAFGCFLGALAGEDGPIEPPGGCWKNAGCVFGPQRAIAWRILDAQYFGVAQRRRRVFLVASARANFDPAAILFEFEGLRRDSAPSRKAGEKAARFASLSPDGSRGPGPGDANDRGRGAVTALSVALRGREGGGTAELGDEVATCLRASTGGGDKPHVLTSSGQPITYGIRMANTSSNGWGIQEEVTHTLDTANGVAIGSSMAVRRLTPRECERLQGFPDNYTQVPVRGKPAADGPRYKSLGNSMAVPCMRWIGRRIATYLDNTEFSVETA
ncbi:DNA cytosine methyltransferase [Herbaspirillum robiniae]|uniref:DNA cytosine methyltransferase n=1 Tax=Herbaspirillum robiniae TaxID=2014887 RepID=UPI003D784B61